MVIEKHLSKVFLRNFLLRCLLNGMCINFINLLIGKQAKQFEVYTVSKKHKKVVIYTRKIKLLT